MLILAAVLTVLAGFCAFALSSRLCVQRYTVVSDKLEAPVRLAVIADLHSTLYGENQAELIEAVRQEAPDAVLFVGDIVDDQLSEEPAWLLFEALGGEFPCYYVTGNHEYRSGRCDTVKAMIAGYGVMVLTGDADLFTAANGQTLCIAGVDDPQLWGGYSLYGGYDVPAEACATRSLQGGSREKRRLLRSAFPSAGTYRRIPGQRV